MFALPDLPYGFDALEPFIDQETMRLHHDKHHAAYVKNLNEALAGKEDLLKMDIESLIKNLQQVDEGIRIKVRNNGGGVANHNMFWKIMCPAEKSDSSNPRLNELFEGFGGFESFKEGFTAKALGRFGSGWVWLVKNSTGKLEIIDTPNQDSPLMDNSGSPILCLDVWEHAYYLKYKNMRADYIEAFWNVVNWEEVISLYDGLR